MVRKITGLEGFVNEKKKHAYGVLSEIWKNKAEKIIKIDDFLKGKVQPIDIEVGDLKIHLPEEEVIEKVFTGGSKMFSPREMYDMVFNKNKKPLQELVSDRLIRIYINSIEELFPDYSITKKLFDMKPENIKVFKYGSKSLLK